ncbi:bifunctional hydroxymethylpyrimidine kinase/phosphomethylpyrimidine kinase [Streptomyces sp. 4N509B]|uniref:bifunctional hydroxymethylpyrimidine kinase/phosphomethylpyrimidine kinase n=1 Tax=Streptomyces sp. 4N509B TaxID=3457413 RepID=UPI003FD27851
MTRRERDDAADHAADHAAPPVCLTIGSSDSGGGAGVQGDIKALAAIGCFAATVVVGVTAQNTTGVLGRHTVPVDFVCAQFDAVRADFAVRAVKVGTTWSAEHITAIASRLAGLPVPVVVDPVMVSAAGGDLAGSHARAALVDALFPVAEVVTPNVEEARLITGDDAAGPRTLAERLVELGARAAVVTSGGSHDGDWFADGRSLVRLDRPTHRTGAEHGAGCAHSALIAGLRAHGHPLPEAVRRATEIASRAVRDGLTSIGRGVHPVDTLGLSPRRPRARVPAHHP